MSTPVTKEDFVRIGKRYNSEEIMNAVDRLLPLARADIQSLAKAGYSAEMLAALEALRDQIREMAAGCRDVRSTKRGARSGEDVLLEEGKNVLRCGLAMATMAVARRPPAPGESPQATREKAAELTDQVRSIRGAVRRDAAALRTRLATLRELLGKPDFAPGEAEKADRQAFLGRLEAILSTITLQAESKKALREQSKDRTVLMDELDGRAYHNMRLLAQVGSAVFRDLGEKEHARMYSVRELSRKHAGASARPATPDAPAPAPAQPRLPAPLPNPAVNG